MGAAGGAIAGVVQAGAGLLSSGGGGGTQYVPNYSSMNEVQLSAIDLLSRNYDMQSELNNAAFQSNLGMQDANYKRLITQLISDQEAQQQQLISQAYQAQAATNVAETTLELQRLQQVYERGAREVASKAEYQNTMDALNNEKTIRGLVNAGTTQEFQRRLAETQAQMSDQRQARMMQQAGERLQQDLLGAEYASLSTQEKKVLMDELTQQENLTAQLAQLGKQGSDLELKKAGIEAGASQQRQELMAQFIEQARQQQLQNANRGAQMGASGLVDPSLNIARQQMAQAINPIDQLKRELGLGQIGQQEALGLAGVQSDQAYLQQLTEAAMRGDSLAQQQLALAREQLGTQRGQLDVRGQQLGLSQQESALQYDANQRGLQNQYASLMNSMYLDAIQNGLAPDMAATLAQRQAEQKFNLTQGSANAQGLLEDYGYDIARQGLAYGRAQDAQSLADYQRMIQSQGRLNLDAAEAQYLAALQSGYAQQAAQQSSLASGASAGINQAASQIRGATMVNQQPSGGFNWGGLGQLAQAGMGLYGVLSGGGGKQGYTPTSQTFYDSNNPFPFMGYK